MEYPVLLYLFLFESQPVMKALECCLPFPALPDIPTIAKISNSTAHHQLYCPFATHRHQSGHLGVQSVIRNIHYMVNKYSIEPNSVLYSVVE